MTIGGRIFGWLYLHRRSAWMIGLLPFVYWAADRAPPFEMVDYVEPAPVYAGGEVHIAAKVHRDLSRNCRADLNRQLLDSNGVLHRFSTDDHTMKLSARSIAEQDKLTPGMLVRAFPIPKELPSGRTVVITDLAYRCRFNPMHLVWPIEVHAEYPFTILPPKPASSP